MKTTICACACIAAFCLTVAPAEGDQIYQVTVSDLTFEAPAGNHSCGGGNLRCTETFNMSFQWDNTTEALGPGSVIIDATGALSAADVTGPWTIGDFIDYPCSMGLCLGFGVNEFFPAAPDDIFVGTTDWETPIKPGVYPYSHAIMNCDAAPTQCDSLLNFDSGGASFSPIPISGTITISSVSSPVPEPSYLPLLCAGALGAVIMARRRGLLSF